MILDKEKDIKINANNFKYYKEKGYIFSKVGDIISVVISDITKGSDISILCRCDFCINEKNIIFKNYIKYTYNFKLDYYCSVCKKIKMKNTNLTKYGTEYSLSNKDVRDKGKITCLEKYGVDNVSKFEIIKDKKKELSEAKWGVEHPLSSKIIRDKIDKTNIERYGSKNPIQMFVDDNKRLVSLRNSKINNTLSLLKIDEDKFKILSYKENIFSVFDIRNNNTFTISRKILFDRVKLNSEISTILNPVDTQISGQELELITWIKSLNVDIIESGKNILKPKHLDVYIPSLNLAIEFNGLYWHSEHFKEKNYHLNKSLKCLEQGIQLLHIWSDEWVFKQDIVKSIILNSLNKIPEKIYARQCDIRVVDDSKLVRQFLDDNHIQGYSQSSIKLGLYHNNELVSLMTFGYRHTNSKKEFELIRFCNKLNLNVVGAASKLFSYFKNNYKFEDLISYSDMRLFDGKMYETLGFEKKHLSKPEYYWCKGLYRYHRFNFNKQKLIKEGYDPNKTEVEIMYERGYFRIFGCGQVRWEFKNI